MSNLHEDIVSTIFVCFQNEANPHKHVEAHRRVVVRFEAMTLVFGGALRQAMTTRGAGGLEESSQRAVHDKEG